MKNLKSENFMFFMFLLFQVKIFTFSTQNVQIYLNLLDVLLFCSVHYSSVWDNLRVLLCRIIVSSVPRTLKI